jgi:hypothetical protein
MQGAASTGWTGVYAILMRSLRAECSKTFNDWCSRCSLKLRLRIPSMSWVGNLDPRTSVWCFLS